MEEARPLIVLVSVTIYLIACVAMGLWAFKKTRPSVPTWVRHLLER